MRCGDGEGSLLMLLRPPLRFPPPRRARAPAWPSASASAASAASMSSAQAKVLAQNLGGRGCRAHGEPSWCDGAQATSHWRSAAAGC
jgi:hypothetical protein